MAYGTTKVDVLQSSAAGTPPQFNDGNGTQTGTLCRAWVRFNSSTGSNVVNASFNVSSVTYNSIGNYTVNFSAALSDANYACCYTVSDSTSSPVPRVMGTPTSSACTVGIANLANSAFINATVNSFAAFR